MKQATRTRKLIAKQFFAAQEAEGLALLKRERMADLFEFGKQGLDAWALDMGRMLAEAIMEIERTETVGPENHPYDPSIRRWGSQGGSIYLGDTKVKMERPRVRDVAEEREVPLTSYDLMRDRGPFSEELLRKSLAGMSGRKYSKTVRSAAKVLGVSPSSVSRRIVEATASKLKEFRERDLSDFKPVAVYLDTVHRGGVAFIVARGIDLEGRKLALGFWEGATENREICDSLLSDLEDRGLKLSKATLFIVDGGKGIQSALKARYGPTVLIQRCVLHKLRNIEGHLPKKYRAEAKRRYQRALRMKLYEDANKEMEALQVWLRDRNESAADSRLEALDEILLAHKLRIPGLLRKTLYTTNPIESMFSMVRAMEHNIKRYRNSAMSQRWLATVLLEAEKGFRRVKGYQDIPLLVAAIEKELEERRSENAAMAA